MTPTARQVLTDPVHFFAFGFGAGLLRPGPGTFGTLVGIPFFGLLYGQTMAVYLGAVTVMFCLGIFLCGESARRLGVHDHGGIVWDEIVGLQVTLLPLQAGIPAHPAMPVWGWIVVGFVLFRIFDISKPPPVRWADSNIHGGFGIMFDDLIAALYAALAMAAVLLASSYAGQVIG